MCLYCCSKLGESLSIRNASDLWDLKNFKNIDKLEVDDLENV